MKFSEFFFPGGGCQSGKSSILGGFCKTCYLGSGRRFISILSVVGMSLQMIEMINILRGKTGLASDIWRNRINQPGRRFLSEKNEMLIKFGFHLVYFEHYLFLLLSVGYRQPVLMTPWLVCQTVVIIIEGMLFFVRMFVEKAYPTVRELCMMICLSFVFLEVYCFQRKLLEKAAMLHF